MCRNCLHFRILRRKRIGIRLCFLSCVVDSVVLVDSYGWLRWCCGFLLLLLLPADWWVYSSDSLIDLPLPAKRENAGFECHWLKSTAHCMQMSIAVYGFFHCGITLDFLNKTLNKIKLDFFSLVYLTFNSVQQYEEIKVSRITKKRFSTNPKPTTISKNTFCWGILIFKICPINVLKTGMGQK